MITGETSQKIFKSLRPKSFRPLWNPSETTRFQTPLKPLWNHTVSDHSETTLKPHGFRPLWNHSETTRFQTTLKPLWNHTVSDPSETTLKPRGFRPLWNHSETTRFQTTLKRLWNHTISDPSETTLKPVWNHHWTARDGVDRKTGRFGAFFWKGEFQSSLKPVWNHQVGFRLVSDPSETTSFHLGTGFGEGRMRQNESWAQIRAHQNHKKTTVFDTRQPDSRRGLLRTRKNRQKPPVFDVFWRFSLIFPLSKKRPYEAKRIVSTILRTLSGPPKTQKNTSFWHSTLVFPERGAPDQKKIAKNPQFLTLDSRIPWEGCTRPKKIAKIAKNPQFLTLDAHFPWEGLHRPRFSWLLGCAKLEKKRKAREREGKDDDDDGEMMMRRWWWWDDDEMMMMMMRWWWWWWWWDDDDDDEMMMIGRRIPQEIF